GRRAGSTAGRTPRCAPAAAPRLGRDSGCTSSDATRDHGADLDLVGVLDHLRLREEQVVADHHGRAGQHPELREQLRHAPAPGDLDRAALRAKMDAHAENLEVARALNPLKAAAQSTTILDRTAAGSYRRRPSGGG